MKKIVFFDIDDVLFKTADFINSGLKLYESYEDARQAIEDLQKLADVAILSQGEYNLQLTKLKRANLLKLFKENCVFIVDAKGELTKHIFSKFKDSFVFMIDNRLDNLEQIKKANPTVNTIWIKRGRPKVYQGDYKPDFIVENLSSVKNII